MTKTAAEMTREVSDNFLRHKLSAAERSANARHAAMMRWHPYRREGLTMLGAIAAVVMLWCLMLRRRVEWKNGDV